MKHFWTFLFITSVIFWNLVETYLYLLQEWRLNYWGYKKEGSKIFHKYIRMVTSIYLWNRARGSEDFLQFQGFIIFQNCKSLEPPSSSPGIDRDTRGVWWKVNPSYIFRGYERVGVHFTKLMVHIDKFLIYFINLNFDEFETARAGDGSYISLPKLGTPKICVFEKLWCTEVRKFTLGPLNLSIICHL